MNSRESRETTLREALPRVQDILAWAKIKNKGLTSVEDRALIQNVLILATNGDRPFFQWGGVEYDLTPVLKTFFVKQGDGSYRKFWSVNKTLLRLTFPEVYPRDIIIEASDLMGLDETIDTTKKGYKKLLSRGLFPIHGSALLYEVLSHTLLSLNMKFKIKLFIAPRCSTLDLKHYPMKANYIPKINKDNTLYNTTFDINRVKYIEVRFL